MAKLSEICEINMGQSPESSTYNYDQKGLPFFQGNADFGELTPKVRVWCSEPKKTAKPNDILISVRAPIGALNIADVDCCIGRGLASITVDNDKSLNRYVWYSLKSKVNYLVSKGTGSTFKAIGKSVLFDLDIPLPTLEKQKRIAATLDKLQSVIAKRKQQLEKLDQLVKARFVEMFGTMPENAKGWTIGRIRDIVCDVHYGSSRKAAEGDSGQYPYLRMNNITYGGELDLSDVKTIDVPDNELPKCSVRRGDVLFNRTNSRELVGKTCVYNRDELMVLAGFIVRVRVNEKAIPEFLSAFLNTDFSKKKLYSMCKEAIGQANINAQELQGIAIYIPPVELQKRFASFIEQIDKSKVAVQKALDEAQLLFDSLMQEYFG